ncbi:hypothetical protein P3H15_28170 [Rhodococcus sp. T2V]|uniref:hypothetical protein n=1 Tax=Rhodococcus sp. T2V TaxID=3034164 RepID=UPI0023E24433|nr:hypothetical protein [Rhodococcus sp. T2V]MDF3308895.1 hypothetical protein [Rhodococcus sp. T2V]
MKITVLHEATSVDALVESIAPGLAPDDRERVATALLKANPGLNRRDRLEVGTVLAVPAVAGVAFTPAAGTSGMHDPVEKIGGQFARAIKDYGAHLAQRHEQYQDQLKQEATLLESEQFRSVLRTRQDDLGPLVPRIEASIEARSRAAAALDQDVQEAVRKLVDTLASL